MPGESMSAKAVTRRGLLSRLQPRERNLVMMLGLVFFLMTLFVLFTLRSRKMNALRDEIGDMRSGLELAYTRGSVYEQKLANKANRESQISDEKIPFTTLIEDAAGKAEVSASNQEEQPPVEVAPGLRKHLIEFDLRNVSLDKLTKFLSLMESNPDHIVLTENLLIRSPSGSEDRLNVEITLASWQRTGKAQAEEEDE